jgi:ABC-type methionine transport system ATPase subunit
MNQFKPFNLIDLEADMATTTNTDRHTRTRIRIRIPKQYHHEPIISNLISHHDLTVNIAAALLSANARDDGWFDLELQGTVEQIRGALLYLNDLDLEIWYDTDAQNETW